MKLVSVYQVRAAASVLYELLKERTPQVNISHREMPTFKQHKRFVDSHPYDFWYLIEVSGHPVGAIYLTRESAIGVFLFAAHRGKGYAPEAIRLLLRKHPRARYLANINPANTPSLRLFRRLGFTPLQHTYEYRP
jgi:RimJ/RimL family protein N-acetyltransferase